MATDPATGRPHVYADRALLGLVRQLTGVPVSAATLGALGAARFVGTACRIAAERAAEQHIRDDLHAAHDDLYAWLSPDKPQPPKEW